MANVVDSVCLGPGDYSGMKGYRYCRTRNTVRLYQEPLAPSSAPNLASTRLHHLRRSRDFARPARIASVLRCNLLRPQKKKKNNNSNNKIVDRSSSGRFSHDLIPMVFVKNPLMRKSSSAISETRFRESELAVFWCSFLLLSFILFLSFPRLSLVIPALLHTQTLYAHITRRVTRVTQFITTERGATFLVAPRAQPQARVSLLIASGTRS